MKFYKSKNLYKIGEFSLTAICGGSLNVSFYKNGMPHNFKNTDYVNRNGYKTFYLNGKCYGNNFTKESWRRFVKLQAFL